MLSENESRPGSPADPSPAAHGQPRREATAHAEAPGVGVLILTHGGLARELLEAGRVISGELEDFEALPLDWTEPIESARAKVLGALDRLDQGSGVLILTDMYGGTPSNVAMSFLQPDRIETVSGVNLPMVVRLGCLKRRRMSVGEMAQWIRNKGRSSICTCSDVASSNRPLLPCEETAG